MGRYICLGRQGWSMPAPHLLGKTGQRNQVSPLLPATVWAFLRPTSLLSPWITDCCCRRENKRGPVCVFKCSVGTWILGPKVVRVWRASCLVLVLLCFPALQTLSRGPGPALGLKRLTTVECMTSLLWPPLFSNNQPIRGVRRRMKDSRRERQMIYFLHSLPTGPGLWQ